MTEKEALKMIDMLTKRQRQIFDLVVAGKTSREIAAQLGIKTSTVKTHRETIMLILNVRSAVQLTVLAARAGVIK